MLNFQQFLNEKIQSLKLEKLIQRILFRHLDNIELKQFSSKVKRAIKDIFNELNLNEISIDTKVRMINGTSHFTFKTFRNGLTGELSKVSIEVYLDSNLKSNLKFEEVITGLTHEFVHFIQHQRSDFRISDEPKGTYKDYLSNKIEIEAFAVNAAQEIIRTNNFDVNKIKQNMYRTNAIKFLSSKSESFRAYYVNFATSKSKKDQDIWKRFIKKFVQHLEERERS